MSPSKPIPQSTAGYSKVPTGEQNSRRVSSKYIPPLPEPNQLQINNAAKLAVALFEARWPRGKLDKDYIVLLAQKLWLLFVDEGQASGVLEDLYRPSDSVLAGCRGQFIKATKNAKRLPSGIADVAEVDLTDLFQTYFFPVKDQYPPPQGVTINLAETEDALQKDMALDDVISRQRSKVLAKLTQSLSETVPIIIKDQLPSPMPAIRRVTPTTLPVTNIFMAKLNAFAEARSVIADMVIHKTKTFDKAALTQHWRSAVAMKQALAGHAKANPIFQTANRAYIEVLNHALPRTSANPFTRYNRKRKVYVDQVLTVYDTLLSQLRPELIDNTGAPVYLPLEREPLMSALAALSQACEAIEKQYRQRIFGSRNANRSDLYQLLRAQAKSLREQAQPKLWQLLPSADVSYQQALLILGDNEAIAEFCLCHKNGTEKAVSTMLAWLNQAKATSKAAHLAWVLLKAGGDKPTVQTFSEVLRPSMTPVELRQCNDLIKTADVELTNAYVSALNSLKQHQPSLKREIEAFQQGIQTEPVATTLASPIVNTPPAGFEAYAACYRALAVNSDFSADPLSADMLTWMNAVLDYATAVKLKPARTQAVQQLLEQSRSVLLAWRSEPRDNRQVYQGYQQLLAAMKEAEQAIEREYSVSHHAKNSHLYVLLGQHRLLLARHEASLQQTAFVTVGQRVLTQPEQVKDLFAVTQAIFPEPNEAWNHLLSLAATTTNPNAQALVVEAISQVAANTKASVSIIKATAICQAFANAKQALAAEIVFDLQGIEAADLSRVHAAILPLFCNGIASHYLPVLNAYCKALRAVGQQQALSSLVTDFNRAMEKPLEAYLRTDPTGLDCFYWLQQRLSRDSSETVSKSLKESLSDRLMQIESDDVPLLSAYCADAEQWSAFIITLEVRVKHFAEEFNQLAQGQTSGMPLDADRLLDLTRLLADLYAKLPEESKRDENHAKFAQLWSEWQSLLAKAADYFHHEVYPQWPSAFWGSQAGPSDLDKSARQILAKKNQLYAAAAKIWPYVAEHRPLPASIKDLAQGEIDALLFLESANMLQHGAEQNSSTAKVCRYNDLLRLGQGSCGFAGLEVACFLGKNRDKPFRDNCVKAVAKQSLTKKYAAAVFAASPASRDFLLGYWAARSETFQSHTEGTSVEDQEFLQALAQHVATLAVEPGSVLADLSKELFLLKVLPANTEVHVAKHGLILACFEQAALNKEPDQGKWYLDRALAHWQALTDEQRTVDDTFVAELMKAIEPLISQRLDWLMDNVALQSLVNDLRGSTNLSAETRDTLPTLAEFLSWLQAVHLTLSPARRSDQVASSEIETTNLTDRLIAYQRSLPTNSIYRKPIEHFIVNSDFLAVKHECKAYLAKIKTAIQAYHGFKGKHDAYFAMTADQQVAYIKQQDKPSLQAKLEHAGMLCANLDRLDTLLDLSNTELTKHTIHDALRMLHDELFDITLLKLKETIPEANCFFKQLIQKAARYLAVMDEYFFELASDDPQQKVAKDILNAGIDQTQGGVNRVLSRVTSRFSMSSGQNSPHFNSPSRLSISSHRSTPSPPLTPSTL